MVFLVDQGENQFMEVSGCLHNGGRKTLLLLLSSSLLLLTSCFNCLFYWFENTWFQMVCIKLKWKI